MRSIKDFSRCPRCGAPTKEATSWAGTPSQFYRECVNCNTYIDTYEPMEHQAAVHRDPHLVVGNFGGYGTGKTFTTMKEVEKHALLTPNGLIVIGAKVTSQYEQTLKRDLENDIPAAWVSTYSALKSTMTFKNGCRIVYRPYEDPDTLRSYNITMFVILEASEVKYEALNQLQTRLRNRLAGVPAEDEQGNPIYEEVENPRTREKHRVQKFDADWRKGIIESNPDAGWVRSKFVLESNITFHGNVIDKDIIESQSEFNPYFSSHIAATDSNYYLPQDFYDVNSRGKPVWWINKFLHGSFAYAEGRVYPKATACVVDPFEIPRDWPRLVAHDYGLRDPSVFLCAAVDKKNNKLYFYKEARTNDVNVESLAQLYFETIIDIPAGGMYCTPIIDPKSGPKRDYDKKSLIDHYLEKNILFQPGQVNLDARIFRLNTYLEQKTAFIFRDCHELIKEFESYKFPERELDQKHTSEKPIDKDNHGINCCEWIVMALPADPRDLQLLGAFDSYGNDLTKERQQKEYEYDPFSDTVSDQFEQNHNLVYGMEDYSQWS